MIVRWIATIALLCLPLPAWAQSTTFDEAIQEGQAFGQAQPQGQDAASGLIDSAIQNQTIPGITPQSQSDAAAQGSFYLDNPSQLDLQGQGALSTTEGGLFLGQSYNLRSRSVIAADDPLITGSQQAASGTQGCITQRVCTQPTSQVVSTTQPVTCSIEYAETAGQCTYPLPQPGIVSGSGNSAVCTDHYLYGRVFQPDATTVDVQVLDTSPSGSPHWNCGGPGSGRGADDWHTLGTMTLPVPSIGMQVCFSAVGGGCSGTSNVCVSGVGQTVNLASCPPSGAQSVRVSYTATISTTPPPLDPATVQAACGSYMNDRCTQVNEQCAATDCTRSYVCADTSQVIDGCATYRSQGCTLQSNACSLTNAYSQCLAQQENYACATQTIQEGCAQESVQVICPDSPTGIRCLDPTDCADTTSVPSTDMALATSHIASLNAIEDDHTADPLVIFAGTGESCRRTLGSGITRDCCALDTALLGCNANEELLQTHRQNGQCVQIGTYCSRDVNLLFGSVCVEHTTSFCCFSSKLTRIIQEQGRPQLAIGWGSAQSPDCRGFTPEELQRINFQAIDFSEYSSTIVANPPDPAQLSSQAQGSPALVPDPTSVPPASGSISNTQVQQDLDQFFQTHLP
ncbi:MAG: conjugal transfer protein TraN [Nitrospirota bacterium]